MPYHDDNGQPYWITSDGQRSPTDPEVSSLSFIRAFWAARQPFAAAPADGSAAACKCICIWLDEKGMRQKEWGAAADAEQLQMLN